jgi:hypothetical protein
MTRHLFRRGIAASAALLFVATAMQAHADPRSKWRVEFDHYARSAGELVLRIAPEKGGTPIDVTTSIPEAKSENQAADLLRDSLRASLGKAYKVEVDDGEDEIIKRTGKTPKFELTLVSNSVNGLSVGIKKE